MRWKEWLWTCDQSSWQGNVVGGRGRGVAGESVLMEALGLLLDSKTNEQRHLSPVDVTCSLGRCRARAKQGGMRFRSFSISDSQADTHVVAFASSTRDWRPATQVACLQRRRMDVQTIILRLKIGNGTAKDEFDLAKLIQQKHDSHTPLQPWTELAAGLSSSKHLRRQSFAMDRTTWMDSDTRKNSFVEAICSVCASIQQDKILALLSYDIDLPCVVQWRLLWYSAPTSLKNDLLCDGVILERYNKTINKVTKSLFTFFWRRHTPRFSFLVAQRLMMKL